MNRTVWLTIAGSAMLFAAGCSDTATTSKEIPTKTPVMPGATKGGADLTPVPEAGSARPGTSLAPAPGTDS